MEVALRPDQDNMNLKGASRIPIQICSPGSHTEIQSPERNVSTMQFRTKSSLLLREQPRTGISLRQRLRDKISSKTPHVDFNLIVDFPKQITAGAQFMIKTAIHVLHRSEPQLRLPPASFRIKRVHVYATYHARAPRDWYASRDYEGIPKRSASTRHAELGELSRYHADRGADLRLNAVPDVVTASLPMSRGEGTAVETQDDACGVWFAGRPR